MVLPFIAAAATGFLEEGVKQKDLYDKRQFELEKQRQASKLRREEQKELYDYKAKLEKAKLDAENAGYNKQLFGVSYNTEGMTTFEDKAIAAVNAVSSDPTSAISYLSNLKRSGNNQLYQQQLAEFKNAYQIAQMQSAKLAGKQMGVVGIPDMARQYSGLTQFLSASGIPEVGNYLREANQSFKAFVQSQIKEKKKKEILDGLPAQTPTNVREAISKRLDVGETMTVDQAQQFATSLGERLKTPRLPAGQQADPATANATLINFYGKPKNNWTSPDLRSVGYHWKSSFTQTVEQKRTLNGYRLSKAENGNAYDRSFELFSPTVTGVNRGQYGFVDVDRIRKKDFQEFVNKPGVRKEIEQKQTLYRTMRDINEPLLEIMDAIGNDQDLVGFGGAVQRIFAGVKGQVDGMLTIIGNTPLTEGRRELADSLRKDLEIVQASQNRQLNKVERLALINSIGNLSAFLLARYAQKDDNKISNDDVLQMKNNLGLNELITDLDTVKTKLSYYIDKSQRDMLELEGYSPQRNPRGSRKALEHAMLWEAMMSSTRGMNPNTGNVVMSPEERVIRDRAQVTTDRFTSMIGAPPPRANLADIQNRQLRSIFEKIETGLGKRLEYDVPDGKPEQAIRQEPLETNKLRDAFAAKGRLRENIYVSSIKVKNEPDKFVVFDLTRNPQDGKSRPNVVVVAENMEQLYEKLSQKAFPRGRTRLIYEDDAAASPAPSVGAPATGGNNPISARQRARQNRRNQRTN